MPQVQSQKQSVHVHIHEPVKKKVTRKKRKKSVSSKSRTRFIHPERIIVPQITYRYPNPLQQQLPQQPPPRVQHAPQVDIRRDIPLRSTFQPLRTTFRSDIDNTPTHAQSDVIARFEGTTHEDFHDSIQRGQEMAEQATFDSIPSDMNSIDSSITGSSFSLPSDARTLSTQAPSIPDSHEEQTEFMFDDDSIHSETFKPNTFKGMSDNSLNKLLLDSKEFAEDLGKKEEEEERIKKEIEHFERLKNEEEEERLKKEKKMKETQDEAEGVIELMKGLIPEEETQGAEEETQGAEEEEPERVYKRVQNKRRQEIKREAGVKNLSELRKKFPEWKDKKKFPDDKIYTLVSEKLKLPKVEPAGKRKTKKI